MAVLLSCNDVSFDYPTKTIFSHVSLGVNTGDRLGIVGNNGDGKSTLLRILSRQLPPDSGQVVPNGTSTIGVLWQTDELSDSQTIEQQLVSADAYTWQADRKARQIVEALVGGLPLDTPIGNLSGGQRRRVDLARLLLGSWDILMLDEPTNHLDLPTINWLANHLKTRWQPGEGALLVVTHDRWFLDEVCTRMWEVHDASVMPFEGGYSAYVMQRVERERLAQLAVQKRNNQLRKELAWLSRGAQARRTKPKFHVEAAQALIADVPAVRNAIELKQVAVARLGKQVLELQDVCVDVGGARILSDITLNIGPGERIGILGANGAGKTTFLRLLSGAIRPTLGHIKTGKTVRIAALSQNLDELAEVEDDVVRVVCGRYKTFYEVDGKRLSPTALLERLGFSRNHLNARVKDLSGGQRRRMQLLLTLLEEPNVLILDEPGNDMDTDMLAVTEDLFDSWPGTLVVVSHDRYLLERMTDDLYAIVDTRIRHMPGGIDEYLATLDRPQNKPPMHAMRSSAQAAQQKPEEDTGRKPDAARAPAGAQLHQARKQLASLERKMATQAERVKACEAELTAADPSDYEQLVEIQQRIDGHRAQMAALEDEWLELDAQING